MCDKTPVVEHLNLSLRHLARRFRSFHQRRAREDETIWSLLLCNSELVWVLAATHKCLEKKNVSGISRAQSTHINKLPRIHGACQDDVVDITPD